MANELRVRGNTTSGTLSGSLTAAATSMSSPGLANLPVVGATQHALITIENEIVYVTAHTAGATTATILRGQEGTTATPHGIVAWYHGPAVSDFDSVLGYAQVTASQTGITTQVDLTGLTLTVTVPYSQHRIKVTGYLPEVVNNTANGGAVVFLMEGATQLQQCDAMVVVANTGVAAHLVWVGVPTAASHTYKLQAAQQNGGTVSVNASATKLPFILVEDLGPAA